jgi:hypothetical protein
MSATLTRLANRDDLQLSRDVRAKLRDRAEYAKDLHHREQMKDALRKRELLEALGLTVRHPAIWKFIFEKVARYARSNLISAPGRDNGAV